MNVCPDDTFRTAEPLRTKLDMVMHHYEPDCLPKRLICCLLGGQGHSEGSYNQNMTFKCVLTVYPFATKVTVKDHIIKI